MTPHTAATDWLTVREAAAVLRVGPRTLYAAIRANECKAARVNGRDLRISRAWLAEWAERRIHG
jgi:excisionase family DNA binding protein